MLSLSLPFAKGEAEAADADPFAPTAFVRIGRDGRIVLTMPYVEMGQGTYTSIPMLIAEELEVDLTQVRLEHAPPNEKLYVNPLLGVQATGNSNAIRGARQPMRQAGATARVMLVTVQAQIQSAVMFGITAALYGEITLKDGRIEQTNFDTYQMLRIPNAPHERGTGGRGPHRPEFEAPGGMGEVGTSAIVPTVANAIFVATGKRSRKLPVDTAALKQPL